MQLFTVEVVEIKSIHQVQKMAFRHSSVDVNSLEEGNNPLVKLPSKFCDNMRIPLLLEHRLDRLGLLLDPQASCFRMGHSVGCFLRSHGAGVVHDLFGEEEATGDGSVEVLVELLVHEEGLVHAFG